MAYTLKIKLNGSAKPPVWRKIKINSHDTFSQLHLAIQSAFGWQNYHLWQFADYTGMPRTVIREPDEEADWDDAFMDDFLPTGRPRPNRLNAASAKLSDYFKEKGDKITYTYDFGDGWDHTAELLATDDDMVLQPTCTGGKGQCPPEDCGGIWGYRQLVEILEDPKHPDHKEMRQWLGLKRGEQWDVNHFSTEEANARMREAAQE
ncbi:plasmid pRiA4b ORF-3 family protein [Chryseobacterium taklimakanense]|uniref:plasmid pRiA4b ORF-3 family protein n=1 Tax=Chryseobacterium taklimakanense TaxID=536441 RepID=UPI001EF4A6D1|nr:plasmid pRiA4b ORF-3 family protein [Chryseobacterium taklimakanense]MCG7280368.1 plasmid pRiA4b ORF-3 family protein [Chryseobacterium taklimakanense]